MPNDRSTPEPETVAQQETGGGCQQEHCSVSSVRAMRMECGKCGGFWVSPENAQKLMDERDEARAERDKAQRIAIKSRGRIVGLEKNVTTAAINLVEFWETQGGGNGVMARALEDALIREVNAYKRTPAFEHSSQKSALWHLPTTKLRHKMATPNDTPAPTKPLMAGCQQEPCSPSLADFLATRILSAGDEPSSPCNRIQHMGGSWIKGNERGQGGFDKNGLRRHIECLLKEYEEKR